MYSMRCLYELPDDGGYSDQQLTCPQSQYKTISPVKIKSCFVMTCQFMLVDHVSPLFADIVLLGH